jgi:hypothetical protein
MKTEEAIKVSTVLQAVMEELDACFEKHVGRRVAITLFVWTDGRAQYISSADRAEVRKNITDLFEMWDKGMPDIPSHEISG